MGTTTAKIGQVSNASVLKHTKKSWDQWITILENAGGRNLPYKDLVAYLKKKYKLSTWWSHGVALGFEVFIERRIEGQNQKGEYSTTATKTITSQQKQVWQYLVSSEGLTHWLQPMTPLKIAKGQTFEVYGGYFGEIRTIKSGERLRLSWQEEGWRKPTYLQLLVIARPNHKCLVVFTHEGIRDLKTKQFLHARWRKVLDTLQIPPSG